MKVLLINDYGCEAGGAEVIVYTLRDALRGRGHEVRVFSSSASDGTLPLQADDLCHGTLDEARTSLQCMNVSAFRRLRQVITSFKPDVAHVNLYLTQLSPFILRALGRVPTIYYAQWYRSICPVGTRLLPTGQDCNLPVGIACLKQGCIPRHYWPRLMVQMAINRIWFSRFNRVTAISNAVANRLKDCGGDAFQHVEVIYPGTKWTLPRTREELTKDPTIICAGRLVPEKGIDILIRAFAQMHSSKRNTRLIIVGDGPNRTSLMGLTDQLGLVDFVDFQGHLSQAGTLAMIRRAWCLCVPSLWEEPFGIIAAEAQMLGVPVIASRAGGLAEIIDEGITGYLVAAGNVDALASRLKMVITNRSLALDLGTESHERAASMFGAEAFAERFEYSYNRLISEVKSQ
jgi:glycosyltransferase involved in cell wall biosynthesis